MSEPFSREHMVDAIATAISDSMDMDWNSHVGAEAVVRNCGVFELYEALDDLIARCDAQQRPGGGSMVPPSARAALAKARGDQ